MAVHDGGPISFFKCLSQRLLQGANTWRYIGWMGVGTLEFLAYLNLGFGSTINMQKVDSV